MNHTIKSLLLKALTSSSEEEAKSILNVLRKKNVDWFKELEENENHESKYLPDKKQRDNNQDIIKILLRENAIYKRKIQEQIYINQRNRENDAKQSLQILVSSFVVILLLIVLFFL